MSELNDKNCIITSPDVGFSGGAWHIRPWVYWRKSRLNNSWRTNWTLIACESGTWCLLCRGHSSWSLKPKICLNWQKTNIWLLAKLWPCPTCAENKCWLLWLWTISMKKRWRQRNRPDFKGNGVQHCCVLFFLLHVCMSIQLLTYLQFFSVSLVLFSDQDWSSHNY